MALSLDWPKKVLAADLNSINPDEYDSILPRLISVAKDSYLESIKNIKNEADLASYMEDLFAFLIVMNRKNYKFLTTSSNIARCVHFYNFV